MGTWYIISVFIHVLCAAFWIGGMLFLPVVLLPGIKNHPDRTEMLFKTGVRFRFYGWIVLIFLGVTGIYNMYARGLPFTIDYLTNSEYGSLLGLKILLFVVMLLIAGIHDFYIGEKAIEQMKSERNAQLKHMARWSGRINLLLSLVIAFLGVALSRGGL